MEAPYLRQKSTAIYTVMAELYSNALEHGVLGLDSALKSSAEGFARYYAARAAALENVQGWVRFSFVVPSCDDAHSLYITVEDSGRGFDHRAFVEKVKVAQNKKNNKGYHGRGVQLLWDLCDEVTYSDPGNKVEVKMSWEQES